MKKTSVCPPDSLSDWAGLPSELVARVRSCASHPQEICRGECTCPGWRAAGSDLTHGVDAWRELCAHWYPTMTAGIVEGADKQPVQVSPEKSCRRSSFADEACVKVGACLACRAGPGTCRLRHSAACVDAKRQAIAAAHTGDSDPAFVSECGAIDHTAPSSSVDTAQFRWRTLFQRRFQRQQAWDAERRKQKRSTQRELRVDSVTPASTRAGILPAGQRVQGLRMRTCKRCGMDFAPHERNSAPCVFHSGRFVAMDEDGVVVGDACSSSRDFNAKAQRLIKAHNRKKGSKKNCQVVFGAACQSGVAREDGLSWRWTCCGDENLVATGCASGVHC